ncbi:TPA: hypothetical protein DDW35_01715, partial [Candidatus Sumerlaeota bacterium]|nr:hypothetical protein [Candidatus Sumerlaeota bacterium]
MVISAYVGFRMHLKPYFPTTICLALVVLFPFIYPGCEVLGFSRLLGADLPEFHFPHQQWIYDILKTGRIPFWNPYLYGGGPEFGNPEMAPFYPPVILPLLLLGPIAMLQLKFVLHLALLGCGFFLFLRDLHFRRFWALLAAWTLMASGFPITKIGLPNVGDSAAWFPLILWLNQRFVRCADLHRGLVYSGGGGIT